MNPTGPELEPVAKSPPATRHAPDTVTVRKRARSAPASASGPASPATVHLLRARGERPGDPDSALENELAMLLSALEFHRAKLAESGRQGRPAAALQAARHMADELTAFTGCEVARLLDANALAVPVSQLTELHTSAQLLLDHLNRTNSFTAILFFWNKPALDSAQAPELFRQVFDTLLQVLRGVFSCLDSTFVAPAAAQQWKQALDTFLGDLAETARTLKC
ncbi:MAG: hypothetical protein JNM56_27365 [Planctomycetia bacterium]|nr:hypothetical protein [Planctomycetia bacterium]